MEDEESRAERPRAAVEPPADERGRRRLPLRPARLAAVALVAALLALLVWRVIAQQRGAALVSAIASGKRPAAPAFALPLVWRSVDTWPVPLRRLAGQEKISLNQLRGRPIVINFWASWCLPCKAEAPLLAATARAQAGKVVFLGIDVQDLESDAHAFLRRYKTDYVSLRDPSNSSYDAYGLTGVPETYYVDRRGRAVAHTPGQVTTQDLQAGIAEITRP